MTEMQRIEAPPLTTLRDGRTVAIRPLTEDDRVALTDFGLALPQDDLLFLENDFQAPEIIARLINAHAAENWRQIVAVSDDDEIVAYSAVRLLPGWSNHVGDLHLIVSENWRRSGLGTVMGNAIFVAAHELGVAKVIIEMLEEQHAGQAIFERLGFTIEGVLSNHACDRHGQFHNLVILAHHVQR